MKTPTITPQETAQKLAQKTITLIDVREPAEHRAEHIAGSTLIPLGDISYDRISSYKKLLVLYCQSGKRSMNACTELKAAHPQLDIYSLDGGLTAWTSEGLPTVKTNSYVLPLDRQTQIAAGILALTGSLLGFFVSKSFFALSGFVGAGLIGAGLTGWCTMTRLLALMPWNK